MNRKIVVCVFLAIACFIAGILGCASNSSSRTLKKISCEVSVDIRGGEIIKLEDTHSKFHSDGNLLVIVQLTDRSLEKKLADSQEWQAFPLDKTAQTLLYGSKIGDEQVGPFVIDRDGNKLFPPVSSGYYWLKDRQPETEQQIKKGISGNDLGKFTLAIYDSQKNMLYYCKMDT